MEDRKIDILGTTYTVIDDNSILEDGYDGYAHIYDKSIRIRPIEKMLDGVVGLTDNEKRAYYREVLRHEIMHCVFAESGVEKWEDDEELVTYLSKVYPKVNRIFAELGCAS